MSGFSKEKYLDIGYEVVSLSDNEEFLALADQASLYVDDLSSQRVKTQTLWKSKNNTIKQAVNAHRHLESYKSLLESDAIRDIILAVFEETPCYITGSKLSLKHVGETQIWYAHQDRAYLQNTELKCATFGVLLEDCGEANGAIHVIPESHKAGLVKHDIVFEPSEKEPQIKIPGVDSSRAVALEGKKGDVLVFDGGTIHFSGENSAGGKRPIFIFQVQEVEGIPLEIDGSLAVVFNYQYEESLDLRSVRRKKRLRNLLVYPVLKKALYFCKAVGLLKLIRLTK